jgi:proteasome lid subunit RPN8/RPN11
MTGKMVLQIPAGIVASLKKHARAEAPNECVGMLAGTADGLVHDLYPLVNELNSPKKFLSEPRSMLAAEKRRRAAGWEVLAIYHSHPTTRALPSRFDVADHYAPEVMCLIVSLVEKEEELRGWWIESGRYEEGQIRIV